MSIRLAESDEDLRRCFAVMKQLRPQYDERGFLSQVRRQHADGYRVAMAVEERHTVAVAGFRLSENLAWGRFLYVDDLVTDAQTRSAGHGARLLDWLRLHAVAAGCDELHLDSGVQRFGAHRFYLRHGMNITSHHFQLELRDKANDDPSAG